MYVSRQVSDLSSAGARRFRNGNGAERFGARAVRTVPDLPARAEPERVSGPGLPVNLYYPLVVSSGQIITPAGTPVYLGITTRAKAIAFNPHTTPPTAAVLQMGAPQSVTVFNALTGAILQNFSPPLGNHSGSTTGIAYSPNGAYLVFSQDGLYGPAYVSIASVNLGRACSQTTPRSAFHWTPMVAEI